MSPSPELYDVIIVGGGAAGLTAAIYAGRKKLRTAVIVGPHPGGETTLTNDIRNYPGYEGPGPELMRKFDEQARTWGAGFIEGRAASATKNGTHFMIQLEDGRTLPSRTVILSYGRERRKLGIPGEEEFLGRGVSTCTTCDAPLFRGKTVAVIGGGNSAMEGALDAASYATKVYLIHRRNEFKADAVTVDKAKANPKIEFLTSYTPTAITGQKFITSLAIRHAQTGEARELALQGVFIEIGYETNISMVKGLVETNALGELVVDERCRTKTPGLYAAGDLTSVVYKQTVISAGMGAIAALEAHRFISGAGSEGEYAK